MDTTLPWYRRLAVRVHLLYCVWCRRYAAQLRLLRHATHQLPAEETALATQKLSNEAKEQMHAHLHQALQDLPPCSE